MLVLREKKDLRSFQLRAWPKVFVGVREKEMEGWAVLFVCARETEG